MATLVGKPESAPDHGTPAQITRIERAGSRFATVVLEGLGAPWTHRAGHVVEVVSAGIEPAYFALASSPAALPAAELLVRQDCPLLSEAGPNASRSVALRGPFGTPYPVDSAAGRDLLLVGIGAGLGALRSALRDLPSNRVRPRSTTLLLGIRHLDDLPIPSELVAWARDGIRTIIGLTGGDTPPAISELEFREGRVQAHLGEAVASLSDPLAWLCGSETMVGSTRAQLIELGVSEKAIQSNTD